MKFIRHFARGRIFGHPIHAMLVHFPSGLFPTAFILDLGARYFQNGCLACAAYYALAFGVLMGFFAALFGALDYARISPEHRAWSKASLHGLFSVTWLILFAIVLGLKSKAFPIILLPTPLELGLTFIGVLGLIFSNYLGGDLIFRHKIGFDYIEH